MPEKRRGRGYPRGDVSRAASHYGVSESAVTREMIENLPGRGTGLDRGTAATAQDSGFGDTGKLIVVGILAYIVGKIK